MPRRLFAPKPTQRRMPNNEQEHPQKAYAEILRSSHSELNHSPSSSVFPPGATKYALDRIFPPENTYRNDPKAWINDRLGEYIWSVQTEISESVRDNRYTAVPACHGPGKSFIAARIMAWWEEVHPLGSAFAISTAPSAPQVSAILWRELRRCHRKGKLRGRITLDNQWYMTEAGDRNKPSPEDELIAMGRKPADYDENSFQGIHARYVLAVLDEAGGIPKQLYDAVNSIVTGDDCRVLAIGNPDDPGSHFATICKPGSGWNVIPISAFDTPNFTGEYVPEDVQKQLVTPGWVREREKEWGIGSPLYTSKVLGEFPDVSDETLYPPALIKKAMATTLAGLERGRYGADIARYGTDKTVVYRNRGFQIRLEEQWSKQDTMSTVGKLNNISSRHIHHRVPMVIDVIGLGAGVYDRMRELDLPVVPFAGSERAIKPRRFINRRAEVFWTFRELMDQGLIDLDPEDETLLNQLGSIKWGVDSSGRIYVESKDDMKKRGMPSPDHADAAVMSTVMNTTARDILELQAKKRDSSITGDILTKQW